MRLTEKFLKDLLGKGLIMEKMVYKGTPSSGAVYLPKALVGKAVRLIIIPLDEDEVNITSLKNKHQKISVDSYEIKELKKQIKELLESKEKAESPLEGEPKEEEINMDVPDKPISTMKILEDSGRFNIDLSPRKEDEN